MARRYRVSDTTRSNTSTSGKATIRVLELATRHEDDFAPRCRQALERMHGLRGTRPAAASVPS
jgi:hypothetical protein